MRQYPAGPLCMRSHLLQWVDTNPYDITGAGGASSSSGSFQAPQFTKQHPGGGAAAITAVLVAAAPTCAACNKILGGSGSGGRGFAYHCQMCSFDMCRECVRANTFIVEGDTVQVEVQEENGDLVWKPADVRERVGRNSIQAGPWDGHMAFGEDANPYGVPPPGGGFGGFGAASTGGFGGFGFPRKLLARRPPHRGTGASRTRRARPGARRGARRPRGSRPGAAAPRSARRR